MGSVTGLVLMEMYKVLQGKSVEDLRNGNFSLGVNAYMLFEADPPKSHKDFVQITRPDPEKLPDAYDEKGNLKEEYLDPDMCLGIAEWVKFYPNPQTKYDKIWVDGCSHDMTLQQLVDKVGEVVKDAGLSVYSVGCPYQRVEVDKSDDHPDGVTSSAITLYNQLMPGTKGNLDKPLAALVKEKTTRSETLLTLDDPVDITSRKLYVGLQITLMNDDGDFVTAPEPILKFIDFDFVPYPERKPKAVQPWL